MNTVPAIIHPLSSFYLELLAFLTSITTAFSAARNSRSDDPRAPIDDDVNKKARECLTKADRFRQQARQNLELYEAEAPEVAVKVREALQSMEYQASMLEQCIDKEFDKNVARMTPKELRELINRVEEYIRVLRQKDVDPVAYNAAWKVFAPIWIWPRENERKRMEPDQRRLCALLTERMSDLRSLINEVGRVLKESEKVTTAQANTQLLLGCFDLKTTREKKPDRVEQLYEAHRRERQPGPRMTSDGKDRRLHDAASTIVHRVIENTSKPQAPRAIVLHAEVIKAAMQHVIEKNGTGEAQKQLRNKLEKLVEKVKPDVLDSFRGSPELANRQLTKMLSDAITAAEEELLRHTMLQPLDPQADEDKLLSQIESLLGGIDPKDVKLEERDICEAIMKEQNQEKIQQQLQAAAIAILQGIFSSTAKDQPPHLVQDWTQELVTSMQHVVKEEGSRDAQRNLQNALTRIVYDSVKDDIYDIFKSAGGSQVPHDIVASIIADALEAAKNALLDFTELNGK